MTMAASVAASQYLQYESRISSLTLILGALAALPVAYFCGWHWGLGILIGSALAWLNFRWLKQGLDAFTEAVEGGPAGFCAGGCEPLNDERRDGVGGVWAGYFTDGSDIGTDEDREPAEVAEGEFRAGGEGLCGCAGRNGQLIAGRQETLKREVMQSGLDYQLV